MHDWLDTIIDIAVPVVLGLLAMWISYSLFVWFFTTELPKLIGITLDNILKATGG